MTTEIEGAAAWAVWAASMAVWIPSWGAAELTVLGSLRTVIPVARSTSGVGTILAIGSWNKASTSSKPPPAVIRGLSAGLMGMGAVTEGPRPTDEISPPWMYLPIWARFMNKTSPWLTNKLTPSNSKPVPFTKAVAAAPLTWNVVKAYADEGLTSAFTLPASRVR